MFTQPGKLLPSAHAIEREYRVMAAVQGHGVPVPQMVALCEDARYDCSSAFTRNSRYL